MTPLDDELRRALDARASRLVSPSDPLAGIESRARSIQRRRQALTGGGVAAVVLAVAVAVPLANRRENDEPQIAATPRVTSEAPSPSPAPTPAPTTATTSPAVSAAPAPTTAAPPPAETVLAALYYVGDTEQRPVLYREFRRVPVVGDPITTAVTAMLQPALDPDYKTLWPAGTAVQSVRKDGEVGTIDLNDVALRGKAGSEHACLTVQQLVWTVTAADKSVKRVLVTVDGKADGVVSEWWGAGCGKDEPIARHSPSYEVLAPVQISNPTEGATVSSKVTFGGEASVFEANVSWAVVDKASGKELKTGFSTATAGGPARGTWEASVTLTGVSSGQQLELRAWQSSPEDGSVQFLDTKTVVVS